jgi:hypothetical protein
MKAEKISIIFIIFFISFNLISNYYASIKLKVNRVGSVKIINNPLLKPRQIYINGIIKTSPYRDTVNIDNIVNFGDEFSIKPIKYNEDGYILRNENLSFLNGKSQNIEETPDKYINFNTLNAKGVLRINDDEIKTYNANIDPNHQLNKITA